MPRAGGAARHVATLAGSLRQLVEAGGALFVRRRAGDGTWSIRRVDPVTGQSTTLASFVGDYFDVSEFAVDTAFVYWGVQETAGITTLYRSPATEVL